MPRKSGADLAASIKLSIDSTPQHPGIPASASDIVLSQNTVGHMGLCINLRGDLAKLRDEELAARLKEAWDQYETTEERFHRWQPRWWLLGKRGPIRHPRAYQFLAALQGTSGDAWLSILFATVLSHKDAAGFVRRADRTAGMHVSLCEIHDIIEEVERRVDQRRGTKT